MPLFLRSSPSKRKLAETTSSTPCSSPLPSLPPPAQLGSPFQLELPFAPSASLSFFDDDAPGPARSGTGSSSSASSSSSSAGGGTTETAPTTTSGSGSDVSLDRNRWSVLDIDAARTTREATNGGKEEEEDEKRLRKKSSSGSVKGLKGFFSGRRRSASRTSEKGREREREQEELPPVPSLPPTIGLLDLSLPSPGGDRFASSEKKQQVAMGVDGLLTPPEEPANAFSSSPSTTAEDDDLASLLRLVHAAGDKAFVDEHNGEERTPYIPPAPQPAVKPFSLASPPSTSSSSFRAPPLASASAFSAPTSSTTPTPSTSTTPTARYSFLSRPNPKGNKPSPSSLLSPFTSSKSSFLTPPTTPPLRDDGGEDDYGAASDEDERSDAPSSSPGGRAAPSSSRSPRMARTPSPPAGTSPRLHPSRSPSSPSSATHSLRTPRRQPLGPRATHLLSLTVSRLSPSPPEPPSPSSPVTQPSTALPAPISTHPSSAVRAAHIHRQPQPLGKTFGRLALLKKLQRGVTMLEAHEIESRPFSASSDNDVSPYLDNRASVISASARLSIVSTDSAEEGRATNGLNGTSGRDIEVWELEHGKLDEGTTLRRILDVDEPVPVQPATPSPTPAFVPLPLPRLKEWAARPSFPERMSETRVFYLPSSHGKGGVEAEGVVVTDVVRPARVGGFGGVRSGRAKVSTRVRELVAALEKGDEEVVGSAAVVGGEAERPKREKKPGVGLLSSPAAGVAEEEETLPPALRAAAAGAASPPSPATAMRGTRAGGGGLKKPLLPGPLLLKALAEGGEDDVEARREEARVKLEGRKGKEVPVEEDDEDDRPLSELKEQYRDSLLPSPRRTFSSSPNRSSTAPQSALLFAQQRAARLESEVARLKAREAEAIEREEQLRREQAEKDQARAREERERVLQRRLEEQRRRSRIANGGGAVLAGRKEGEERKSPRRSSTLPPVNDTAHYPYSPPPQNYLAVPRPYGVPTFAVPIPVPVPFYQVPVLSASAPDLQQLQTPRPTPAVRAPSPSPPGLPGSTSRQSLLPPPVMVPPFSPPRQASKERKPPRSPRLPPSASQPHLPCRDSLSPSTPTSKRQSSQPPPPAPRLPHAHSSPAGAGASLRTTPASKRVSHQPFLSPSHASLATAMPPTVIGRSRSSPLLASPQRDGGRGTSPKRPAKTGGAAFLGVEGGRRRDGVAG